MHGVSAFLALSLLLTATVAQAQPGPLDSAPGFQQIAPQTPGSPAEAAKAPPRTDIANAKLAPLAQARRETPPPKPRSAPNNPPVRTPPAPSKPQ